MALSYLPVGDLLPGGGGDIQHSKLKHSGEAMDDNNKELILHAKITDKHDQGQDTLPYC